MKTNSLLPALPRHLLRMAGSSLHSTCPLPLFLKHLLLSLIFFLIILPSVESQRPLGSWNIISARLNLNNHWSIWTEGQLRSIQFYDEFFYFEAKGGITYNLKDHVSFTGGIGDYQTFSLGGNFEQPRVTDEVRTWLQLAMDQKLDRINFEHRYRVEQRHLNTGYKNRFRYRLNTTIPLNHKEILPKTIYAYFGDEIFFTDKPPYYERNRFFAGLGYKVSSVLTLQSGYMRQYDYKLTSETSRDFLQVALLFNLHLEDFHRHSIPSTTD